MIRDLTTTILRGDKVGIIGPNASGKTTLIRLLLGDLPPRAGDDPPRRAAGDRLLRPVESDTRRGKDGHAEHQRLRHDPDQRPAAAHPGLPPGFPVRARTVAHLVKFLSGGERSRLLLAKLFTKPSNLLVLDEPTNDLDVETLELLESLLVEFQGTVLLVSHDRAFLNEVVTSTLAIEADGQVKEYDGGYDDYVRQRPAEISPEPKSASIPTKTASPADRPRKLSFKERKELESLPSRIESLETEIRALHEAMADPAFYRRDSGAIVVTKTKLAELEHDLATTYTRPGSHWRLWPAEEHAGPFPITWPLRCNCL